MKIIINLRKNTYYNINIPSWIWYDLDLRRPDALLVWGPCGTCWLGKGWCTDGWGCLKHFWLGGLRCCFLAQYSSSATGLTHWKGGSSCRKYKKIYLMYFLYFLDELAPFQWVGPVADGWLWGWPIFSMLMTINNLWVPWLPYHTD